jgi:N utilization substance protein A
VDELRTVQGMTTAEEAAKIKDSAERATEKARQDRLRAIATRGEPPTEHERLTLVKGIGERTAELLAESGYKRVEDVVREDDDRFALRTGFGIKKARSIKQSVLSFAGSEKQILLAAREEAKRAAAEAEGPILSRPPPPAEEVDAGWSNSGGDAAT